MPGASPPGANAHFIGLVSGRHRCRDLDKVVAAIAHQSLAPSVAIGVGIASADALRAADIAAAADRHGLGGRIEVVETAGRPGAGAGAQHGALNDLALARGFERYIGLDAAGIPHHGAVQALADRWATIADADMLEMRLFPDEHPKLYDVATGETAWCSALCFGVSTRRFKTLGGFDDRFAGHFHDVDLSWRLRAEGGRCYVAPRALFLHDRAREPAPHDARLQALTDARRLAWKWGNAAFQGMVEDQLVELGVAGVRGDLDPLSGERVSYEAEVAARHCDFDHGLDCASVRW